MSKLLDHSFSQGLLEYLTVSRPSRQKHPKVSLVTVCGNRLHHLQKTFPRNLEDNLEYPNVEHLILDYGSTDGVESWLRGKFRRELQSGRVGFYRTESSHFHMAHSKNVGHRLAKGPIVCNVDADNFTGRGFCRYVASRLKSQPQSVLMGHYSIVKGTTGRICLYRRYFEAIRGYDEEFEGYGYEDTDLSERCRAFGLDIEFLPAEFLNVIQHSDEERAIGYPKHLVNLTASVKRNLVLSGEKLASGVVVRNDKKHWGRVLL